MSGDRKATALSNGCTAHLAGRALLNCGSYDWYESIEQMQRDFDTHLHHYNHERPHQGRMMEGRTPAQNLDASKTQQPEPQDVFAEAT